MTTLINTYQIAINAPPEKVFAYVSDLTRHPEWSGGRLRIEAVSSGSAAVGSQYISHGDLPGQKNRRNELRVSKVQPPSRFAFIASDPGFGDILHEFTFTPHGNATLVERRVSLNVPPITALALRAFIQPLLSKPMMDKSMAALKSRLEGQ
jgi:uncharacterized protein YndB with AHSA1/START domain